jgi:hypothetical protein
MPECVETSTKGSYTINQGSSITIKGLGLTIPFNKNQKQNVNSKSEDCTCPEGKKKTKTGSVAATSKGTVTIDQTFSFGGQVGDVAIDATIDYDLKVTRTTYECK